MDYRHRNYYLISTDYIHYAQLHKMYKKICPSIKYHSAREFDFWWKPEIKEKYPWLQFHPQEMISVKKEESAKLIKYITEWRIYVASMHKSYRDCFMQITKEHLGQ